MGLQSLDFLYLPACPLETHTYSLREAGHILLLFYVQGTTQTLEAQDKVFTLPFTLQYGSWRGHRREEWKREGQFKPKERSRELIK